MKKFFVILICLLLLPVGASAITITINDPAGDQIGDSVFDSFFIEYTVDETLSITIGTNYPEAGYQVGDWNTLPADLLLDGGSNGKGWDYAIPLVDHDSFTAGEIYSITSLKISDDFEPSSGGYGYNNGVPVQIESGTALPYHGNWVWNDVGSDPAYNIGYIEFNWYWTTDGGTDPLTIGWATATCANDPIGMNPVPEPSTILLMGIGLLGLVGYSRKRSKKS
ncbi:MAG: PEP-CTERM sorting domain-containing protein [Desulfobulbaceae bacterium]|nr:PEP-CTERM sorting domain-containing protein [Desulfobulbaceae bacterium]